MKDTGEPPMGTDKLPMTQFAVQGDTGRKEYTLVVYLFFQLLSYRYRIGQSWMLYVKI